MWRNYLCENGREIDRWMNGWIDEIQGIQTIIN